MNELNYNIFVQESYNGHARFKAEKTIKSLKEQWLLR